MDQVENGANPGADDDASTPSTAEPATDTADAASASAAHVATTRTPWSRRRLAAVSAGAAFALVATGASVGTAATLAVSRTTQSTTAAPSTTDGGDTITLPNGVTITPGDGSGFGLPGRSGDSSSGTSSTSTTATDAQSSGVVLIDTVLGYAGGEAAGTGIVLTSSGEILTNNHVVEGSTSITVTIASTGKQYTADVVGTDSTDDIAVLQLEGASGLTTADLDTSGVAVGDSVTGVGNAEGQGYLSAAAGTVTDLEQSITVSDELTNAPKQLTGLIETDAPIVSGDSGGPLLDADGEVVGIDTAASSNTDDPTGYAIPIADALAVVKQIESGVATHTITIGLPAFLGVQIASDSTSTVTGAAIGGALTGTPAADAGLARGDVITAIDGTPITSADDLSAAIAAHDVGDSITVHWTGPAGGKHTATVTLIAGPAA